MTDDAQQRIEQLERDKRFWKRLAVGLMIVFVLTLAGWGVSSIAMTTRARAAEELARQSRNEAEQQRQRAMSEQQRAVDQLLRAQAEAAKGRR